MSRGVALAVIVVGGLAAYLLLRPKASALPSSSPTIPTPIAPGHTTT